MDTFVKRLLTVLVALLLVGYVGYQAFQIFYSPLGIETVYSRSVYETVDVEGLVIRDETIVPKAADGYYFYTIENGSRVAKDGTIAKIFPTEQDAWSQFQLDQLDEEIAQLQLIQEQGTSNRVNLELINKRLDDELASLVQKSNSAVLSDLSASRSALLSLLNKQQITTGKVLDFSERMAALQGQRNQLAKSFAQSSGVIRSPVAGYFVSTADGYESAVSYADAVNLTAEKIRQLLEMQPAVPEAVAGKVVGDYKWYLACVVPAEKAGKMGVGAELSVKFPFVSSAAVPIRVSAVNKSPGGNVAVIFECSYMSQELSSVRSEPVQIQITEHTGLSVPDAALQFNAENEPGVYVRVGNTIVFRKVKVRYHSETGRYSICEETDEDGYLKLYDDMVIGGKELYDGKIIR